MAAPAADHGRAGVSKTVGAPAVSKTVGAPAASLTAVPARPTVGQPVRLHVAAAPGVRGFAWDLGGGAFSRHTGVRAQTETDFSTPGIHAVAVRFIVAGQTRLARAHP